MTVPSGRIYHCGFCQRRVVICRRCDRGNRYCPPCSKLAPARRLCRAGRRYQKTEPGRSNHKIRQQRYLARRDEKARWAQSVGDSAPAAEGMKARPLPQTESAEAPHPIDSRPGSPLVVKLHCEPERPYAFRWFDAYDPPPPDGPNLPRSQEKMTHRGDLTGETEPDWFRVSSEVTDERRCEPPGHRSSQERCDFCGRPCVGTDRRPCARHARMFRRSARLPRYRPRQAGGIIGVSE